MPKTRLRPKKTIKKSSPKRIISHSAEFKDKLITHVKKASGTDNVRLLSETLHDPVVTEWINTGFLGVDEIVSLGKGLPIGNIVEIWGPYSSGKSAWAQLMMRRYQDAGGFSVYLDYEDSLDPVHLRGYGIRPENVIYAFPPTMEEGWDIVRATVNDIRKYPEAGPLLIVWDSVASAPPKAEVEEKKAEQSHVGLQARAMSKGLRKLRPALRTSRSTVIFVNQVREKIGVVWGSKDTRVGGRALDFYADVILKFIKAGRIKKVRKGKTIVSGYKIKVDLDKSRHSPLHQQAEFILSFTIGPDASLSNLNYLKEKGLVVPGKGKLLSCAWDGNEFEQKDWPSVWNSKKKTIISKVKATVKKGVDDANKNEEEE